MANLAKLDLKKPLRNGGSGTSIVAMCTFCGAELIRSPLTYVERPNPEARRTELALACPNCAPDFRTRFSVV